MSDGRTQKIVDAAADVARQGMGRVSPEQLQAGWQRLERALDDGKYPSVPVVGSAPRWWLRGLALTAAALVLGLATQRLLSSRPEAPLHYVVEGATLGPDESIHTGVAAPARVVFSDTSEIRMAPATRVQIVAVDGRGSRIALADGALDVMVHHRRGSAWRFDAGPFRIKVVGTAFHLAYQAARGRLQLAMVRGVVEASGPSPDRVFTLRAGESLELVAGAQPGPAAQVVASPPPSPVPSEAPPALVTPALPHVAVPPAPQRRAARSESAARESESWTRMIARGDFAAVVRAAQGRGIDATLAGASAADLTALADAARYTRRTELARQALLGLRARFPGTSRSSDAAFFLGRLAELTPASTRAALAWYQAYLDESGRGPYAGEAMGRELALLVRTDRARARKVAQVYLERFPHGAQAELARSLVESAPE